MQKVSKQFGCNQFVVPMWTEKLIEPSVILLLLRKLILKSWIWLKGSSAVHNLIVCEVVIEKKRNQFILLKDLHWGFASLMIKSLFILCTFPFSSIS